MCLRLSPSYFAFPISDSQILASSSLQCIQYLKSLRALGTPRRSAAASAPISKTIVNITLFNSFLLACLKFFSFNRSTVRPAPRSIMAFVVSSVFQTRRSLCVRPAVCCNTAQGNAATPSDRSLQTPQSLFSIFKTVLPVDSDYVCSLSFPSRSCFNGT